MDPIISLQIVERELAKLRFASLDQNPHGIRDLLTSAITQLMHERKQIKIMTASHANGFGKKDSMIKTFQRVQEILRTVA